MPSSLKANELSQWTHGNPDLIGKLFLNLFEFLRLETNKGKDPYGVYAKINVNISFFISLLGDGRLYIPQLNMAGKDASALLGAYLRQGITIDDVPIVELSPEQIEVVHTFVNPLIPPGFTAKQFFDGLKGKPSEKHAAILKLLIFKDIPAEQLEKMHKDKYAKHVNSLIESILNLADFMRTPFNVLVLEEKAAVAAAKKMGSPHAQTSGIDLQWTSMYKAIEQSLQNVIETKKGKSKQAGEYLEVIRPFLVQCQACFGLANTRYQVEKEAKEEARKREEEVSETFKELGIIEKNAEKVKEFISKFRQSIIEKEREPTRIEELRRMTLSQLITAYGAQWQNALERNRKELADTKEELEKLRHENTSIHDESDRKLSLIQQQLEESRKELEENKVQIKQHTQELEILRNTKSSSSETIQKLQKELEKEKQKFIEKRDAYEQLKSQFDALKRENENLQIKLQSYSKQEQLIIHLQEQLKVLQHENELLRSKSQPEEEITLVPSEDLTEVLHLRSQLQSLQEENEILRHQDKVRQQANSPDKDVSSEVVQLRSEIQLLRQQNSQLREELSKVVHPIDKIEPKSVDLTEAKIKLSISLGHLRLNQEDTKKVADKIIESTTAEELVNLQVHIVRLQKINAFIDSMNQGILKRAGFFSSDPYKKTQAIETSFQQLSIEEKYRISQLSEQQINEELRKNEGEESDIGKFLKSIHHKRGFIPIHQATSFTFFKSNIDDLQHQLNDVKPETIALV